MIVHYQVTVLTEDETEPTRVMAIVPSLEEAARTADTLRAAGYQGVTITRFE